LELPISLDTLFDVETHIITLINLLTNDQPKDLNDSIVVAMIEDSTNPFRGEEGSPMWGDACIKI